MAAIESMSLRSVGTINHGWSRRDRPAPPRGRKLRSAHRMPRDETHRGRQAGAAAAAMGRLSEAASVISAFAAAAAVSRRSAGFLPR